MSARMSRRAMLTSLAAAPLAATPARATPPHPDATILTLAADYFRAHAAYRIAARDDDRIRSTWEATKPPKPDAMRREGDARLFGGLAACPEGEPFYDHGDVVNLRKFEGHGYMPAAYRDTAVARAREIVAAHDNWQEAVTAHADACGLSASNRRCDEADDARSAVGEAVKAARPTTLEGFIAKARVGQVEDWPEFDTALREDLAAMAGTA